MKNCKECGKLFVGLSEICDECRNKEESDFKVIYGLIRDNEDISINEIVEKSGFNKKKVLKLLRKAGIGAGLELGKKGKDKLLKCKNCGKEILIGSYCRSCAEKLRSVLK